VIELLSNAFAALKEAFGFKREQAVRENTPEMQAAAKGSKDQEIKDTASKALAAKDEKTIRNILAD
jgi:hypothetical protein